MTSFKDCPKDIIRYILDFTDAVIKARVREVSRLFHVFDLGKIMEERYDDDVLTILSQARYGMHKYFNPVIMHGVVGVDSLYRRACIWDQLETVKWFWENHEYIVSIDHHIAKSYEYAHGPVPKSLRTYNNCASNVTAAAISKANKCVFWLWENKKLLPGAGAVYKLIEVGNVPVLQLLRKHGHSMKYQWPAPCKATQLAAISNDIKAVKFLETLNRDYNIFKRLCQEKGLELLVENSAYKILYYLVSKGVKLNRRMSDRIAKAAIKSKTARKFIILAITKGKNLEFTSSGIENLFHAGIPINIIRKRNVIAPGHVKSRIANQKKWI